MARKKQSALEYEYDILEKKGITTSLRPTIKVMSGKDFFYVYDVGCQAVDDPQKILSEYRESSSKDYGFWVKDKLGDMWNKNFQVGNEPRWLEGYISLFGAENITVEEWGKYKIHEVKYWKGTNKEYTVNAKKTVEQLLTT